MLLSAAGATCRDCGDRAVTTADGRLCGCPPHRRIRLYIAGPMSGIPLFNHPEFERATVALRDAGYDVASPHLIDPRRPPGWRTWAWYMKRAIPLMLRCGGVALLDGWRNSTGAQLEYENATRLAMPVKPVTAWLMDAKRNAGQTRSHTVR